MNHENELSAWRGRAAQYRNEARGNSSPINRKMLVRLADEADMIAEGIEFQLAKARPVPSDASPIKIKPDQRSSLLRRNWGMPVFPGGRISLSRN